MRLLYAEDDEDLRTLYSLILKSYYQDMDITYCSDGQEAINKLKVSQNYDLIISDYDMPVANGGLIYKFLIDSDLKIPYLLLTGRQIDNDPYLKNFTDDKERRNVYLTKPIKKDQLIIEIDLILNRSNSHKEPTNLNSDTYERWSEVSVDTVLKSNNVPCDVYIRINSEKFIKIIDANTMYASEIVLKYKNKGARTLFIKRENLLDFVDNISRDVLKILEVREGLDDTQNVQNANLGLSTLKENLLSCGLSKSSIDLAQECIDISLELVKKNENILNKVAKILDKEDYLSNHVHLINFVTTGIIEKLDWTTESTATKLILASILHDITLDTMDAAKVQNFSEKGFKFLNDSEQTSIKRHPIDAANIVKNFESFPPGIDSIIMQHHERPDGTGFPKGLNSKQIQPLACVFIVAEEFVNRAYRSKFEDKELLKKIIVDMKKSCFNEGNFKRPYEAISKLFKVDH
ncbi:MAG: response regulator [Halobacteriovoraceae bacterium]|nr:response regulator [Halobacteriovoraceae bacterium]